MEMIDDELDFEDAIHEPERRRGRTRYCAGTRSM